MLRMVYLTDTAPTAIYAYGHPLSLHDALPTEAMPTPSTNMRAVWPKGVAPSRLATPGDGNIATIDRDGGSGRSYGLAFPYPKWSYCRFKSPGQETATGRAVGKLPPPSPLTARPGPC